MTDVFAKHAARRARLIEENTDAPADTLVRAIFDLGCTKVVDVEERLPLATAEEALDLWYNLDEMRMAFVLPDGRRGWVYLIHQYGQRPHVEDVSDYTANLEDFPTLVRALDETTYRSLYVD